MEGLCVFVFFGSSAFDAGFGGRLLSRPLSSYILVFWYC